MRLLGDVESILYILFFVLAGLHFDISVLATAGVLALVIVVSRGVGKYGGTVIGATISSAPSALKHYLGLALLPEAGVTVGLALLAATEFPSFGELMLNAVLAATIINELIAPPLSRRALVKAGEARVGHSWNRVGRGVNVQPASTEAAPKQGQLSTSAHQTTSGPGVVGSGDAHIPEGSCFRSQRAGKDASRHDQG